MDDDVMPVGRMFSLTSKGSEMSPSMLLFLLCLFGCIYLVQHNAEKVINDLAEELRVLSQLTAFIYLSYFDRVSH